MLNEKINSENFDRLDFSRVERLTPHTDSWDRICTRLDAADAEGATSRNVRGHTVSFRILSAVPLAASLVLIGLSVLMTAFSGTSESVSINSITSTEVARWYDSLGDNSINDGFDTLDENVALSYFYKETK